MSPAKSLCAPVFVIAQVETFVVGVECCSKEEQEDAQVAHLLEAAIGGVDAAADNLEFAARDFLAQKIILGKHGLLVETAEFMEALAIEHHEHPGGERLVETGEVLEKVASPVKDLVGEAALAEDVRRRKMQVLRLHLFQAVADQRVVGEFDVGVEKQNIGRGGQRCAAIAPDRRQAAGDYLRGEAAAKAEDEIGRSIYRTCISD